LLLRIFSLTALARMMIWQKRRAVNSVASAYDFSGFGRLVDVGGSHGALLIAILKNNPELRGVLFDQPHVVEGAREPLKTASLLERCEIVGGDMFGGGACWG